MASYTKEETVFYIVILLFRIFIIPCEGASFQTSVGPIENEDVTWDENTRESKSSVNYNGQENIEEETHLTETYSNVTSAMVENDADEQDEVYNYDREEWMMIFDSCQIAAMTVGVVVNVLTVFALNKNGEAFSPVISLLVRHQSVVDTVVCILGILMLAQPPMWTTGENTLSLLVCQVWHGQFVFWSVMFISIYNLTVISWERYLAVCRPLQHVDFTPSKTKKVLLCLYLFTPIEFFPCFFQVRYLKGACLSEYYFPLDVFYKFMIAYGVYAWATIYAIPCAIFFIMYGLVVITMVRRRGNTDQLGSSRVIDKATTELTKTAIVVTGFFIVALGYDLWYYMLGRVGAVIYLKNTPLQKAGMFLAAMNSVANPFIYAMFMPSYRIALKKTLLCTRKDLS